MTLSIKPLHPTFGAEISGVDISAPLDAETAAAIRAASDRYGVCVFRDTGLNDESHVAFSRIFGHLEKAPSRPDMPPRHRFPELFDASNLTPDGEIVQDEAILLHKKGDRLWHTDSSFMKVRSSHSLLLAHEVPPVGGETWFADTRTAYDDLPQAMKERIEGLEAVHSLWWSRRAAGAALSEDEVRARPTATHPLVHVHEGSGRKGLFIAAHAMDIAGLPSDEGRALLAELIAFATQPQYVFAVEWHVGDLVVWDNFVTMHRGGDYDARRYRRDMRRTTVRAGAAPAAPDDPFGDMFRASFAAARA